MVITVGGVVLNVTLNWILMFGKLGFPALGLVGCGWASTVVYWLMFLTLFAFIGRLEVFKPYGVFARLGKPDPYYFFEIFRIGWPIGIMQLFEVSLFSATAMMMGLFGTVPLAAHQIAINCAAYAFMVPLGLSYAVAVRVGQAAGRGDSAGVRQAGFVGIGLGASLMTLSAIGFWTIPGWIIRLFMNVHDPANAEVVRQGAILLGVAAVFQIFDGIQVTAAGGLERSERHQDADVGGRRSLLAGGSEQRLVSGVLSRLGRGWSVVGTCPGADNSSATSDFSIRDDVPFP